MEVNTDVPAPLSLPGSPSGFSCASLRGEVLHTTSNAASAMQGRMTHFILN
jgi:hypothetical protein